MTRDETIALWLKCEDARAAALADGKSDHESHAAAVVIWNVWADDLITTRQELEKAARFKTEMITRRRWHGWLPNDGVGAIFPGNKDTADWHDKAKIDFSSFEFAHAANFQNFHFPGETIFARSTFKEHCSFENTVFFHSTNFMHANFKQIIKFEGARFKSLTLFEMANFDKDTYFNNVTFEYKAWFSRSKFNKSGFFSRCSFHDETYFFMCRFGGAAWFEDSTFDAHATWARANFEFTANFRSCRFRGNTSPTFVQTSFHEYTDFGACYFNEGADFQSAHAEKFFGLGDAKFSRLPKFNQANFKQAPDFDDVSYPLPYFWKRHQRSSVSSYRALRRLAIQGYDYENEAKAFKGEIRSKRGTEHKPWHAAFWFGVFYDGLSDFGQSMTRPVYSWAIFILLFSGAYLANANKLSNLMGRCADGEPHWLKALYLSVKNALLFIGAGKSEEASAVYSCLYGVKPGTTEPFIPISSAFIQIGQNVLSAVLIFLFLLAVRNQFKIK